MTSDRSLLERQMADIELRPFTLDEFHHRRHRKQRNRRIATAAMGLVVVAVVAGGLLGVLRQDDEKVDTNEILGPGPSPFEGTWTSSDVDGSSQTLVIVRTEGDQHEVVLRDESAGPCSGGPSTETGTGQARSVSELVVALQLTCDDGSALSQEPLAELTFFHDPATDELTDSVGVVWRRPGAAPADPSDAVVEGPSQFEGIWVVSRKGQYFPDSLEIRVIGDGDLHEAVSLKAETPQCAGGPSTMRGTGRRATFDGIVQLSVTVRLTCDDGSTPVPQSPTEEVISGEFGISYTHDPVTDELIGSLGSVFIRQGAQPAQGDPMAPVERMVDAVNSRDADAFRDVFAPDGQFGPRGAFRDPDQSGGLHATSDAGAVAAWMAINDAWDFEADVLSCTADPAAPFNNSAEADGWIECEVAARWPKLFLETTERWRFEARGERLVAWAPEPLELDPADRDLPLGYEGLQAWESWLEENHPEDAARWLEESDPTWVFGGRAFWPDDPTPYDPEFADDIEASINEYLEEQ